MWRFIKVCTFATFLDSIYVCEATANLHELEIWSAMACCRPELAQHTLCNGKLAQGIIGIPIYVAFFALKSLLLLREWERGEDLDAKLCC